MPGASDRTTDEHWAVVTTVNDILREFNAVLEQNDREDDVLPEVKLLGNFDAECVESTLDQRQTKAHIVQSKLQQNPDEGEWVSNLEPPIERLDSVLAGTDVFE